MKKIIVILLFAYPALAMNAVGEDLPKRSFSLSLGYLADRTMNSNEGLADFPLGVIESYGALFDLTTESFTNHWWSRLITSILELPVSAWLTGALMVPFHEFGHARSVHALGLNYRYATHGYGRRLSGDIGNFWELSFWRFITPPIYLPGCGNASTRFSGTGTISNALHEYWGNDGIWVIIAGSGLNNQSLLGKKIAHAINRGHGHIMHFQHYIGNKVYPFIYSKHDKNKNPNDDPQINTGSDIGQIVRSYRAKGYSISHSDIEFQSLISLVSASTFALFKGYFDYIYKGNPKVFPLEFYGVRLPDINSYINARGLSLEIESGFRWSEDLFFDLAYEFIWKGDSAHQITPSTSFNLASIAPRLGALWLKGDVVIGKGWGGSLGAEWEPFTGENSNFWQRFSYFGDVALYNGFNLYGERNIPSLHSDKTASISVLGGIRINY